MVNVFDGRVDIVYGFLEVLVGNLEWRELMCSSFEVLMIVIDEFYIIVIW